MKTDSRCVRFRLPLSRLLRANTPPRLNSLKQSSGWFVAGVLPDQFASECFGEGGLVELFF
ncbi:MAG: hypothetical protein ABL921_19155 [Pirellula sp.]